MRATSRRCSPRCCSCATCVGEFEKPKFFHYKQKICAHSRNEQIGCTACIDVCSAQAIRSDASMKGRLVKGQPGGSAGIVVEPHLCVGCGACTTVCPSGAFSLRDAASRRAGPPHPYDDFRLPARWWHGLRRCWCTAKGAGAAPDRRARPAGAHRPHSARRAGAGAAARCLAHRVDRHRSVAVGDRLRRVAGLGVDDRRGGARLPFRGDSADGGRAGDPDRAGVHG